MEQKFFPAKTFSRGRRKKENKQTTGTSKNISK